MYLFYVVVYLVIYLGTLFLQILMSLLVIKNQNYPYNCARLGTNISSEAPLPCRTSFNFYETSTFNSLSQVKLTS